MKTFCSTKTGYVVAAWTLVVLFSAVCLLKEILHFLVLRRHYFNLERITRILFVILVISLYFLLLIGQEDAVASLSVVCFLIKNFRNHVAY